MIAGELDFCQVAGPAVVNAVVAGEDLVFVGGLLNSYVLSLVVLPTIETANDIKGKAVAINKPGGASDTAMRDALKSLGLEPEKDVALLVVGGMSQRLAAMESGQVVGTIVAVPQTVQARELGYREMIDMATLDIPYQHLGIATTRSYLDANREVSSSFMKAVTEAIALMKEDKEGTIAVMAQYLKLDVEEDAPSLNEAYDRLVLAYLAQVPYPSIEGVNNLLEQAESPDAANYKAEDVVDLSIVEELEASGFIADLYR
jgi:NitT/TauT family transport system substrate-binding protein